MFQVFRPLPRYWIRNIIGVLFWSVIIGYLAFHRIFILAIILFFFLSLHILTLRRLRRTVLKLDEQSLFFQVGKETVQISWKDVLMVRQTQRADKRKYLDISTQQKSWGISLTSLDTTQIWYWVQRYAPPEALQDDAYKRVPSYQEWLTAAQKLVNTPQEPLRAGYPIGTKIVIGFIFTAITTFYLLVLPLISTEASLWTGLIVLILGGWWISSLFYRIEMTSELVASISLWQRQQIEWREVEYIEHNFGQHRFVLYGTDKRLAIPGPQTLGGKNLAAMAEMLQAQITCREIELRQKERALFTRSRNVTIKAK